MRGDNKSLVTKLLPLLIVLFNFFYATLWAQENTQSHIIERNAAYYSPLRENIHLHLNKTTFFKGESVWYTAYVLDQRSELPSSESTNLHVDILSEKGEVIDSKMILLQNGIGFGNFTIDSKYTNTDYFIKSYTNWKKNFSPFKPFVQQLKIFQDSANDTLNKQLFRDMAISIYPEGGKLIQDLNNTVGFKISNHSQNNGTIESISLVDNFGLVIKDNLVVNSYGMGLVTFFTEGKNNYSIHLNLKDGTSIHQELPPAEAQGIVLHLSSINSDKIYGEIEINPKTLDEIYQKPIYIAVHKNGKISIQELKIESESTSFLLEKAQLPSGVNALTVFDDSYNPIIGRLFFNEYGRDKLQEDLSLTYKMNASEDSLRLTLNMSNSYEGIMSLSITALPLESTSYAPDNSLLSSFLIIPFLDTPVEHPQSFTKDWNRRSLFDLDILLLIQGWGTYNWDHIFKNDPKMAYAFEAGVRIKGKILDADLEKERFVWAYTSGFATAFISQIERDKYFSSNAILFEGDSLRISVLNAKQSPRKPKAEVEFTGLLAKDSINTINVGMSGSTSYMMTDSTYLDIPVLPQSKLPISDKTILLDEVVLTEQKSNTKNIALNSAIYSGKRITDEDIKRRVTVLNYLRRLGYRIRINEGTVTVLSKTFPPGAVAAHMPVPVIVGGMLSDGTELLTMPLSRVQTIFYDNLGYEYISLNLRSGHYIQNDTQNYISFLIDYGFVRPEKYYNPGYTNNSNSEFRNYGVLDWHPQVILNKNEPVTVKIPIMNQNSILLQIEGMGSDGKLVSTTKSIDILKD